jgi:uncharacterized membrane protein (UPF0182 family)
MNQEPDISKELTLLNQQGSRVIQGNLLVIPIKDAIVYVMPIYIQAESSPMPELKRVVVSYSDRIAMTPDITTSLNQVFGGSLAAPGSGQTPGAGQTGAPQTGDAALAKSLFDQATAAQKAGDWATYGKVLTELGSVLDRMTGGSTAATSTTTTSTPAK